MRLNICFLIRQLFPFLYAEVIRPAPTEGKWGVMENRGYWCFSIKTMNIHSSCATLATQVMIVEWLISPLRHPLTHPMWSAHDLMTHHRMTISGFVTLYSSDSNAKLLWYIPCLYQCNIIMSLVLSHHQPLKQQASIVLSPLLSIR